MPFSSLSGILNQNAQRRGISVRVETAMILEFFNQIAVELFGKGSLKSMRPLYVQDEILTVAVLSPALAEECKLNESKILEHVNQKAGRPVISSLRFLS